MASGRVPPEASAPPLPELDIDATQGVTGHPPGAHRQTWLDSEGRLVATGGFDGESWWMHWPNLATFWFGQTGRVRVVPVRSGLEPAIHDVFQRGVVPVVLLARGNEGLHASAFLGAGGVIGFSAESGTGKSTLAMLLSVSGFPQFADDTLMYRETSGLIEAFSLEFPVRVDTGARHAIGRALGDAPRETVPPGCVAPITRIYRLIRDRTLDPRAPRIAAVPASRRFEVLLAHAMPFEMGPDARRRLFLDRVLHLARTVDVATLRFAPDLDALPWLAEAVRAHAES